MGRPVKRAGITGATGAIGTALIKSCIEQGVEVFVFVRRDSARTDRIPEHPLVHLIFCSLDEMSSFDASDLPCLDVFYHFAWMKAFGAEARNDLHTQIRNIDFAVDAVSLAHRLGCKRFIGAGSQAEYGRKDEILRPDTPCDPENGYGMAKLSAGQMTRLECGKLGMEHIWVRVLSVYGPYDGEGTLVMSVIKDALSGTAPACTKGGQVWDYLYSLDAGKAFFLLGSKGVSGKTYVLGNGSSRVLRHYIDKICEACADVCNASSAVKPRYGDIPYSEKQVMRLEADISELTRDTGFISETTFEEGIRDTVKWYIGTTGSGVMH
ncbi:MAG: NAD(P)-dependent oxidoreductase [Lachnospiraceae bacterium]|nr:NAD(P)-dependent oxidoreductase [Lachnospiraceae bacterium]